jgi:hypothetical protein
MSWQDAHRYRDALRAAEADLDRTGGNLVWRPQYAEVFGSSDRLRQALRSYWRTLAQAQADWDHEVGGAASEQMRDLVAAHPGLARALGIVRAAPSGRFPSAARPTGVVLEGAA